MSPRTRRPDDEAARPAALRRRALLIGIPAAVLVAALVTFLLVRGGSGSTSPTAAAASGSSGAAAGAGASGAAGSPASVPPPLPTPTPTGPTADATDLPAALPPVPLSAAASQSNGIVATLPKIEGIQGTATGPGNIAGPAVRVAVRLANGTGAPVSLGGVAVNMYYGADRTPASPLDDPSQRPFGGTMLAPGATADGVYVFSVPADARNAVTVEVGYQAGAPLLLFTGPVR